MADRTVCRALLLTPEQEILLIQVHEHATSWTAWITPGGGMEDGETPEDTLRRELFEELGLRDFTLGPPLWTRDHSDTWEGVPFRQRETFYLVEIDRFPPTNRFQPEVVEIKSFRGFRWWPVEEICASEEIFVPLRLGEFARDLLRDGPARTPFDAGI
jgi:8-oxo-dGTP pyrophosphatase MutT (NUDIX family)